jgi:Zn-dependent peptidase ImmA (M78 family)
VLERQGVFVFQFTLPLNEARGFSLLRDHTAVVVVNQSDAISARIFTLFHEYAHVLLAEPGICVPEESTVRNMGDAETFCNRFAAALLIPRHECKEWERELPSNRIVDSIERLTQRYQVSRYVVLGRMRAIGMVSARQYEVITQDWETKARKRPKKRGGGGLTRADRCIHQRGERFISLVLAARNRTFITSHDALNYLGVKLNDLGSLESRIEQTRRKVP